LYVHYIFADIEENPNNSERFIKAYPNPFTNTITLRFSLEEDAYVSLNVFDSKGKIVKRLINANTSNGNKEFIWNGNNEYGAEVSPGIYFYNLTIGNKIYSGKMLKE